MNNSHRRAKGRVRSSLLTHYGKPRMAENTQKPPRGISTRNVYHPIVYEVAPIKASTRLENREMTIGHPDAPGVALTTEN